MKLHYFSITCDIKKQFYSAARLLATPRCIIMSGLFPNRVLKWEVLKNECFRIEFQKANYEKLMSGQELCLNTEIGNSWVRMKNVQCCLEINVIDALTSHWKCSIEALGNSGEECVWGLEMWIRPEAFGKLNTQKKKRVHKRRTLFQNAFFH